MPLLALDAARAGSDDLAAGALFSPKRLANANARNTGRKGVSFVVDSGCTWHIHPYAEDSVTCDPQLGLSPGLTVSPSDCRNPRPASVASAGLGQSYCPPDRTDSYLLLPFRRLGR
eukprot:6205184-Pleurochrysis_carterae.AAC.6